MDRTLTFTVQVDAPRDADERAMAIAIHRAIEYAKDNDIEGTEALHNDIGQVTVL